jgi:formamidopyrimidine-DNA glycosylase
MAAGQLPVSRPGTCYAAPMPEIPDLEAIRDFFSANLRQKTIASVETRIPPVFRTPAKELRETLPGDLFGEVLRHGKFLLFPLASARVLAINPMLTGRFQFLPSKARVAAKTCLIITFENEDRQLRYADDRLMGKVYLVGAGDLALIPNWATNGPDLLDAAFTEDAFVAGIKRYRGAIKNIITNAEFVQGIGNAYSDEILWEAQINPYTVRTKLTDDELRGLHRAARQVMAWATPLAAERMIKDGNLDYEERRDFLRVHRLGGKPCPRCGTSISEITANQRITSFCRQCQPGGPAGLG